MSKGGQGTTQQARGSFSGNSQSSYGGNQATGLGSKGGSQSYQQPYRSPYGQGPSYSQHGMRSGFSGFMENPRAIPTQNPNFEIRTRGPESLAAQEQYIPVPPGQPVGIATNGMPTLDFSQGLNLEPVVGIPLPVSGDSNNAEASMRFGQVAPQQFSGGLGSKGGLMNQSGRGYRSGIGGFF